MLMKSHSNGGMHILNFEFCSPTKFVFGRDTQSKVGALVKEFGGSRVLVVYGGGSVVRSGLLAQVLESLDGAGLFHMELGGVKPNPRSDLVYEGISLCKELLSAFRVAQNMDDIENSHSFVVDFIRDAHTCI